MPCHCMGYSKVPQISLWKGVSPRDGSLSTGVYQQDEVEQFQTDEVGNVSAAVQISHYRNQRKG